MMFPVVFRLCTSGPFAATVCGVPTRKQDAKQRLNRTRFPAPAIPLMTPRLCFSAHTYKAGTANSARRLPRPACRSRCFRTTLEMPGSKQVLTVVDELADGYPRRNSATSTRRKEE
jgi:hypothetical protein